MKRLLGLVLLLAICMVGCSAQPAEIAAPTETPTPEQTTSSSTETSSSPAPEESSSEESQQTDAASDTTEANILVAYFSASGNTKAVAEDVASFTGGTLYELTPENPYTEADLDWTDENSRVVTEHEDPSNRDSALANAAVPDWESYDIVFLGYPIWWGEAAWPVDDFVTSNNFDGKTVIPFCTSTSSGIGDSGALLAEMAASGNWVQGERFSENVDASEVDEWVSSLAW